MEKDSDILFFVATHGDEAFTIPIMEELAKEFPQQFSWIVANELALEYGVRFVDADLNRSAPGDPNAVQYEARRAIELLKIAKRYRFVIDLHGTTANSGIFVIVPNPTPYSIALAACLPISNVVVWATKMSGKSGALTQFVNCGVGIECGPKSSPHIHAQLQTVIRSLLAKGLNLNPTRIQNWFRVYGKVCKGGSVMVEVLQDFRQTTLNGENFYPLLLGQYEDVVCYKMERISFPDLLAY